MVPLSNESVEKTSNRAVRANLFHKTFQEMFAFILFEGHTHKLVDPLRLEGFLKQF